jgi:hypothetical protein
VQVGTGQLPAFEGVFKLFSAQMNFVMSFSDIVGNEQHVGQEAKNIFRIMLIECASR